MPKFPKDDKVTVDAATLISSIEALAGGADLPTTVAKVNAILAALKTILK